MRDENNKGGGRVNVNTASKEQLANVQGIGDDKAEEIVKYREENGEFSRVEDLEKVPGVGMLEGHAKNKLTV